MKNYNLKSVNTMVIFNNRKGIIHDGIDCASFNGELNGKGMRYYHNGKIKLIEYCKNDKLHGKYMKYYENGNKWEESNYKNHLSHGKRIVYDENGKIIYEFYYQNDKVIN